MIDASLIAAARAVPIVHEIHRRGIQLRRVGLELVGPCPVCGDSGKGLRSNRFAVHLRKNVWLCRQCRAGGDVVDLVQHLDGTGFREAVAILTDGRTGDAARCQSHDRRGPDRNSSGELLGGELGVGSDPAGHRDRALKLWEQAAPIVGTVAERYLRETRRLTLPPDVSPRVLRFHPRCPFGEGKRNPCLLVLYRDIVTDEPRAIMRTALTPDGQKIDRKALGFVGGAAIKLSDGADVAMALVVGEGLETTLAGMMRGFAPAWALGSSSAIAKFPVLPGIEVLTILGEPDDANVRAVRECFERWNAAGREIYRATSSTGDMNDALMAT